VLFDYNFFDFEVRLKRPTLEQQILNDFKVVAKSPYCEGLDKFIITNNKNECMIIYKRQVISHLFFYYYYYYFIMGYI
jgi:hypothetical protein